MFRRKIELILEDWLKSKDHNPIVIKGARQCGKTYSVRHFAETHFDNVVYMDFHMNPNLKRCFNDRLDVETILMNISLSLPHVDFVPKKTCIIFDEIQDCAAARASLKFFKLDGRFEIMCTGSLLGVNGYKTREEQVDDDKYSIPVGYEDIVNMYPMDFEEWLWANGVKQMHIDYLKECLLNENSVSDSIHERMRELLFQYAIVGGMPKVVSTFIETKNYGKVRSVQQRIVEEYKVDMLKYARTEDKSRIRECFESIPSQLARENKKFTYALVRKHGRSSEYIGSLQWIEDAGIIRRCYNLETTELPLDGNRINDCFKVYMGDTGLFVSMLEEGTAMDIMNGNILQYKGAIAENLLADILGKMGRKLYYYKKGDKLELDFVLRYQGECVPLECKATTGNAKSLKTVLKNKDVYHVRHALKLGDYNVGRKDDILTIPLYMGFLLKINDN